MMLDRDLFEFLEHTTDAAFAVTDGGEICSWNSSAEALFGFGGDEVIGKTCFELFQGRDVLGTLTCTEQCQVRDCAAHHAPIPDFDLEVSTRAGARIWVNMSTLVHEDPQSGRRRVVHLARSVDDRKRSEVVVQRMLEVAKQLVEVSDRSLRPAPVNPLSEQEHRVLYRFSEGKARLTSCTNSTSAHRHFGITSITSIKSSVRTIDSRPSRMRCAENSFELLVGSMSPELVVLLVQAERDGHGDESIVH